MHNIKIEKQQVAERELQGSQKLFLYLRQLVSPLPKISQRALCKIMLKSSCQHDAPQSASESFQEACVCVCVCVCERGVGWRKAGACQPHDTAKQSATRAAANMTRSRSARVLSASCSALIFWRRVIGGFAPRERSSGSFATTSLLPQLRQYLYFCTSKASKQSTRV
jgi:hypothetical protein